MAKSSTQKAGPAGRPITDFFSQKSSRTPSSQPTSSPMSSNSSMVSRQIASGSTSIKGRASKLDSSSLLPPAQSTRSKSRSQTPEPIIPAIRTSSRTRDNGTRKPTMDPNVGSSTLLSPTKAATKRKSRMMEEQDGTSNDVNTAQSPRKPNAVARKRLRLTPPASEDEVSKSEDSDVIPMQIDSSAISSAIPITQEDISMDLDHDASAPLFSSIHEPLTPPSSTSASYSSPSNPVTSEDRTAQLIAEARAKALAAVQSSPELMPVDFNDTLEDSDDEDLLPMSPLPVLKNKGKGKAKSDLGTLSVIETEEPVRTSRYNLREPSSSKRPETLQDSHIGDKSKPRKSSGNPLDKLLKEKTKADKAGHGSEAMRKAMLAVEGRNALADEMDDEDDARHDMRSSSPDFVPFDDDAKKLLGSDQGEAVQNILTHDRDELDEPVDELAGVVFWMSDGQENMDVDATWAPLTLDVGPAAVPNALKSCMQQKDYDSAILLLNSGALCGLDSRQTLSVLKLVLDAALFSDNPSLSTAAFRSCVALTGDSSFQLPVWTSQFVWSIVERLSPRPEVVQSLGHAALTPGHNVSEAMRNTTVYRLVQLLRLNLSSIPSNDVNEIMVLLILIGMDHSTPEDLRQQIVGVIDGLCCSMAIGNEVVASLEVPLCNTLLSQAAEMTPINKRLMLSMFSGGSVRGVRVARWLARSFILGITEIPLSKYSERPSLAPLLGEVMNLPSTKRKAQNPRAFLLNDNTDYLQMGHYTELLAVALTDIDGYVKDDKDIIPEHGYKDKEKDHKMMLPLLHKAINDLHGGINDTRAAHLDRSQTKGLLKLTALRIEYQRKVAKEKMSNGHKRPLTVDGYFRKPN